jgi:hypothetical protein
MQLVQRQCAANLLKTVLMPNPSRSQRHTKALLALMFGVTAAAFVASKDEPPSVAPALLVRLAVENEVKSNTAPSAHFMFKDEKKTAHLWQTKLVIETREATASMVIEQDGHPLTPEQKRAEESRLEAYARDPEELGKKRKQEKEDAERTEKILRALPDAFLFEPDGTHAGTDSVGRPGDELVRLNFRPNPKYDPPSRVEQVLTGMSGHILVDAKENHIAEIDGTLQKEVGFGWGILGHLDRGGRFVVQQADVGGGHWEATRMELAFTGKILLFKKMSIRSVDVFSNFRAVPANLSFTEGVQMLEKESGALNQNAVNSGPGAAIANKSQTKQEAQDNICCSR